MVDTEGGEAASQPTNPTTDWKIVVATDGSECATRAQEVLAHVAFPAGTAFQVVAVAADPFASAGIYGDTGFVSWQVSQELLEAEEEWLRSTTEAAAQRLSRSGWQVRRAVRVGGISHEILLAAEEAHADLIVLGTKGLSGLNRFLLGSTARTVARHASCSVLVARGQAEGIRSVVLAVDGSEHSIRAIQFLARLPLPATTRIVVAHVVRPYHPLSERLEALPGGRARFEPKIEAARRHQQEAAEGLVHSVCEQLTATGRHVVPAALTGDPAEAILKLAESEQADLIVAGARGVSPIAGLLVGSVAEALLQGAPCSVLLVR